MLCGGNKPMGFSVSASTAVLLSGLFIALALFSGALLPAISEIQHTYHPMKSRAVEQRQSGLNISAVTNVSWWHPNWNYRKLIKINHDYIDESLQNFPVLISIDDKDLINHAQADGADIAFIHSNNSFQFSHELEYYNSGKMIAWVNITDVYADRDTLFFMYYGAGLVSDQQDPEGVWDSNYRAVWHMVDSGLKVPDSTVNANDADKKGAGEPAQQTDGKIGYSQLFDGNDDYLNCGNDDSLTFIEPLGGGGDVPFTIEVFIQFDSYSGQQHILTKWDESSGNEKREFMLYLANDEDLTFRLFQEAGDGSIIYTADRGLTSYADSDVFHQFVITYDATAKSTSVNMFRDGKPLSVSAGADTYSQMQDNDVDMYMGQSLDRLGSGQYHFRGELDEIRLSQVIRNSAWLNASYACMNNSDDFISVEKQQYELSHTYLNITFENTGSETHSTGNCTVLINGEQYTFVNLQPYIYPKKTTSFLVNVSRTGDKTCKLILDTGKSDYFTFYP